MAVDDGWHDGYDLTKASLFVSVRMIVIVQLITYVLKVIEHLQTDLWLQGQCNLRAQTCLHRKCDHRGNKLSPSGTLRALHNVVLSS